MSDPVLDADGKVDKDASRRVEVKFRLKDEEMIQELNKIMQGDASSSEDKTAGFRHGIVTAIDVASHGGRLEEE